MKDSSMHNPKGLSVKWAAIDTKNKEHREQYKVERQALDTDVRYSMQITIRNRVVEGKTKQEIIEELKQNEDYKQYEKYFDGYVDNYMKKKETLKPKKQQRVNEEEMER